MPANNFELFAVPKAASLHLLVAGTEIPASQSGAGGKKPYAFPRPCLLMSSFAPFLNLQFCLLFALSTQAAFFF